MNIFVQNANNVQSCCFDLACDLMAMEGFENRKKAVNSLPLEMYHALNNWCYIHLLENIAIGVCCRFCCQQNNSKLISDTEPWQESQGVCHLIGKKHVAAVIKLSGNRCLHTFVGNDGLWK